MALSIALISANRCLSPYPVYPLGVSIVAQALADAGHRVLLLDVNCHDREIETLLTAFAPGLVGLSLRNVDDVNITLRRFFAPDLFDLARRVRAVSRAPMVLGGSAYSLFPTELLVRCGADFGIRGEGEAAMSALAQAIDDGTAPDGIPGVVRRDANGTVVTNPGVSPVTAIPRPMRGLGMVPYYLARSAMLNVQTQRGCPFNCCYCTYPLIEGARLRRREAPAVVEEMARAAALGARYFFVVDSVFNTSHDHVAAICDELIRQNLGVHWACFLRPQGVTPDLVALMSAAGLRHIEFGSDSFCDRVLQAYGKNLTFDDILASSEAARAARVRHAHFIIVGGPGETEETMRESFANSRRLKKTVIFPYAGMRVYPGTPLHGIALEQKAIAPSTSLFEPLYYLSPALSQEQVFGLLSEFQGAAGNWIAGDPAPEMLTAMQRMRELGVEGPLWEFLIR